MKKAKERNSYSKIRILISIAFGILLLFALYQMIADYLIVNPASDINFSACIIGKSEFQVFREYFDPFLLALAMILFTLNRKVTDYFSFTIFIFLLAIFPVDLIDAGCLDSEYFSNCARASILVLLFLGSPILFLITNFIKNTGKK